MNDSKKGNKNDEGKTRWGLLPWGAAEQVVRVLMFGADKYSVDNWQHVDRGKERYFDAAMRHLLAWKGGEKKDLESGLPHLAHAACCLLFLIWFDEEAPEVAPERRKYCWGCRYRYGGGLYAPLICLVTRYDTSDYNNSVPDWCPINKGDFG